MISGSLAEVFTEEKGAVFFHAPWSGPSVVALRLLRQRIRARSMPEDQVRIIDVDAEAPAIDRYVAEGLALNGYGEAAVIRNGRIDHFTVLGARGAGLVDRVETFLDETQKA